MASERETTIHEHSPETVEHLLRDMLRIRIFDDVALQQFKEGDIPGFLHLCHGHEGSHAGMGAALRDDDWLAVGGSRLHGQYIVKGVPMTEIMAEIYGKATGPNKGKGGSMHLADIDRRLYGHAATIGSGQNPAVGMALGEQMNETGNAVVTTIGDGGTSRGSFHTALVFASVWDLPIVFVIENNGFAISYDTQRNYKIERLSDYGKPLKIPSTSIDGRDPLEVYETVSEALDRARDGGGPTVIEIRVRRIRGHFEGDKEVYRTAEEKQESSEKWDPIVRFRKELLRSEFMSEDEYDAIREEIEAEVRDAVEFAEESPPPNPDVAYEDIYVRPFYGEGE
ncbi:thiamine pyrophosphate-dependent dehydrogenase E1 component subunit alpha [Halomarina halobia]|uniref:Thiamine pyrophosphate-dependent dehydrogenase E1 component subunit alpha n=1 Tax=Halomarina halobia TaxID=3033386 RepID=A0ABD6AFH3_9EURY|nr:thiamine pyrophosphate-dependent dehydrogenase E1 component subunit alpha [Halomarina sp. PSR21]